MLAGSADTAGGRINTRRATAKDAAFGRGSAIEVRRDRAGAEAHFCALVAGEVAVQQKRILPTAVRGQPLLLVQVLRVRVWVVGVARHSLS